MESPHGKDNKKESYKEVHKEKNYKEIHKKESEVQEKKRFDYSNHYTTISLEGLPLLDLSEDQKANHRGTRLKKYLKPDCIIAVMPERPPQK